jgi:hypothetical protein
LNKWSVYVDARQNEKFEIWKMEDGRWKMDEWKKKNE